ncbi:MLP-like protein 31 [Punica granatum]|uniref:MLP-like protein 31 n=1 Tax=Punica granatum TaxID=22663 RepID=A0A218XMK0_PUNGR|nr:MLP-like protein 31 [Punica granatum]OWM86173.1 hypothetical protein CDL15_Pgr010997 [Punica granatum]
MAHLVQGRMEIDIGIRSPPKKLYNVFSSKPQDISDASPDNVHGTKLHEGDWGKVGSVIHWDYVHDGQPKTAKERIDALDDENNKATFSVIEGDLLNLYKTFILIVQATAKEGGTGTTVHWTIEYEKVSEETPEPYSLLEFAVKVTRDIDANLTSGA